MIKITFEFDDVATLDDIARGLLNQAPNKSEVDLLSYNELVRRLVDEEARHKACERELVRTQDSLISVQNQLRDSVERQRQLQTSVDSADRRNDKTLSDFISSENEVERWRKANSVLEQDLQELRGKSRGLTWDLESAKRINGELLVVNEALRSGVGTENAAFKVIVAHLVNGQKISAIKAARTFLDIGLKEGKDFVELLAKFGLSVNAPKKEVDRLDSLGHAYDNREDDCDCGECKTISF